MKTLISLIISLLVSTAGAQNYYIAHRGASFMAPENTVASVKQAWELGADAVEVNIHLAADNRVMVIHDKDTHRTCNGKNFSIKSTPSVVLRDLDAGSWKDPAFKGERIPYLEEIISLLPDPGIQFLEIRCGSEIIPHLERILNKSTKKVRIVFISYELQMIAEIKKAFPNNKTYWISGSRQVVVKKLPEISRLGINGISMHFSAIDKELVTMASASGLEIIARTVDDPNEARRLSALGVTHFITSRPDWLKQQLTDHTQR